MTKTTILAAASVLLLAGCENDMKFRGGGPSPKIILNSLPAADMTTHDIELSESVFIFGGRKPQLLDITELKVKINDAEVPTISDHANSGVSRYSFPAALTAGDRIEITAKTPTHGTVSSIDIVPPKADIIDLKTERFTGPKDNKSYLRTLVTLRDRPAERNFYQIKISSESTVKSKYYDGSSGIDHEQTRTRNHEVYVDQEILFNNMSGTLAGAEEEGRHFRIFSDELFADRDYTLDVFIQLDPLGPTKYVNWDGYPEQIVAQKVTVTINTLSEHTFRYLRSLESIAVEDNFSEPVKIYSNVAGGYGILGSRNSTHISCVLE